MKTADLKQSNTIVMLHWPSNCPDLKFFYILFGHGEVKSEPSLMLKWLFHILIFATFGSGKYQNKEKPLKRQRKLGLGEMLIQI